jgi:hypothetical protein
VLFLPSIHRENASAKGEGEGEEDKNANKSWEKKENENWHCWYFPLWSHFFPSKRIVVEKRKNERNDDEHKLWWWYTTRRTEERDQRKEEKSKQVIITHPNLFHCSSHLGLIKGDENWSHNHSLGAEKKRGLANKHRKRRAARKKSGQSAVKCEKEEEITEKMEMALEQF